MQIIFGNINLRRYIILKRKVVLHFKSREELILTQQMKQYKRARHQKKGLCRRSEVWDGNMQSKIKEKEKKKKY